MTGRDRDPAGGRCIGSVTRSPDSQRFALRAGRRAPPPPPTPPPPPGLGPGPPPRALPANRTHDVLVGKDVARVSLENDLATINRAEAIADASSVGQMRFGDEYGDPHSLDRPHRLDEP